MIVTKTEPLSKKNTQERDKIWRSLPLGWARQVAERCNVTPQTVYRVLNRMDMDNRVFKEILKIAEQRKEEIRKLQERIDKLAKH